MMCIYKITDKTNGMIYIGKTKNLKRRIKEYKNKSKKLLNKKSQYRIMQIIHEKGFDNFDFDVLEEITNKDKLDEREIYWIAHLDSRNTNVGYNSKCGGIGGSMIQLSRDLMSKNSIGFRHSEEEKIKRSKPIIAICILNDKIFTFKSAKDFAIKLGIDGAQISHAIKRGISVKGYYVYYQDAELRDQIFLSLKDRKTNGGYNAHKSFSEYSLFYKKIENSKV